MCVYVPKDLANYQTVSSRMSKREGKCDNSPFPQLKTLDLRDLKVNDTCR